MPILRTYSHRDAARLSGAREVVELRNYALEEACDSEDFPILRLDQTLCGHSFWEAHMGKTVFEMGSDLLRLPNIRQVLENPEGGSKC